MGLLPTRNVVRDGSASKYEGTEIVGAGPDEMRGLWGTEMAMVFQDPMTSLNPVMTDRATRSPSRCATTSTWTRARPARRRSPSCARVGIPEPAQRVKEYPHQLSGGMRQRVMIAIALACGPKLLFADEPTTALDVTVQAQILDLLQAQQTERHMAMILVTHDLGVVAGRTDDIAVMYAGKVVEQAPTNVLFADVKQPYTEALLKSIPKLEHTEPHPARGHPGAATRPRHPPEGCNFAPALPVRPGQVLRGGARRSNWSAAPGHEYPCWFPVGTPEGAEALARNQADGATAAAVPARLAHHSARGRPDGRNRHRPPARPVGRRSCCGPRTSSSSSPSVAPASRSTPSRASAST